MVYALKAEMVILAQSNVSLRASNVITTDNCGTPIITYSKVVTPGNCDSTYTILNTWTATDVFDNSITESQTITVIDNTAPTI